MGAVTRLSGPITTTTQRLYRFFEIDQIAGTGGTHGGLDGTRKGTH